MAIAWGILVPLAVGASLLRDALMSIGLPEGGWFPLHKALNITAIIFTIIAFSLAVKFYSNDGGEHFEEGHPRIGLVIFIMVFVQAFFGFVRPPSPKAKAAEEEAKSQASKSTDNRSHSSNKSTGSNRSRNSRNSRRNANNEPVIEISQENGDSIEKDAETNNGETSEEFDSDNDEQPGKKTIVRFVWEIGHRLFALAIVILAWINCTTGIGIMAEDYGPSYDKTGAFWGVTAAMVGIVLILAVSYRFCCKQKQET
jgi:hypothetical protein